uniref:Uncharacterized protein n=1 Tax=Percolomonas cosmopolitus TaxID=63605 RepID=A0A7S1KTA2_9EUKA
MSSLSLHPFISHFLPSIGNSSPKQDPTQEEEFLNETFSRIIPCLLSDEEFSFISELVNSSCSPSDPTSPLEGIDSENYRQFIQLYFTNYLRIELNLEKHLRDSFDVWICMMGIILKCERRDEIIESVLNMPKKTQESVMLLMKHAMECWPHLQEGAAKHNSADFSSLEQSESVLDDEQNAVYEQGDQTIDFEQDSLLQETSRVTAEPSMLSVDQFIESISPRAISTGSPMIQPQLRKASIHRNRILMYENMVHDAVAQSQHFDARIVDELHKEVESLHAQLDRARTENETIREENEKLSSQLTEELDRRIQTPTSSNGSAAPFLLMNQTDDFSRNVPMDVKHIQQIKEERDQLVKDLSEKENLITQWAERWTKRNIELTDLTDKVHVLETQLADYKSVKNQVEVFRDRIQELIQFKKQAKEIKTENNKLISENCSLHEELEKQKRHHQKQLKQLKGEVQELSLKNKELLQQQERFDSKAQSMQLEMDSKVEMNAKLSKDVAQLTENLHQFETLMKQQTMSQELRAEPTSSSTAHGIGDILDEPFTTELKQKMHRLEQENHTLHLESDENSALIQNLTHRANSAEEDLTTLVQQKEQYLGRIESLERDLQTKRNFLDEDSMELKKQCFALSAELSKSEMEKKILFEEKQHLAQELKQVEVQLEQNAQRNQELEGALVHAEEASKEIQEKCAHLQKTVREQEAHLQRQNDDHEAHLEEHVSHVHELRAHNKTLKKKQEKLLQDLSNLYETNQAQQQTIQKYKRRLFPVSPRSHKRHYDEENIDINSMSTVKLLKDRITHLEKDNNLLHRKVEDYRQRSSRSTYSQRSAPFYELMGVPFVGMPRAVPQKPHHRAPHSSRTIAR